MLTWCMVSVRLTEMILKLDFRLHDLLKNSGLSWWDETEQLGWQKNFLLVRKVSICFHYENDSTKANTFCYSPNGDIKNEIYEKGVHVAFSGGIITQPEEAWFGGGKPFRKNWHMIK